MARGEGRGGCNGNLGACDPPSTPYLHAALRPDRPPPRRAPAAWLYLALGVAFCTVMLVLACALGDNWRVVYTRVPVRRRRRRRRGLCARVRPDQADPPPPPPFCAAHPWCRRWPMLMSTLVPHVHLITSTRAASAPPSAAPPALAHAPPRHRARWCSAQCRWWWCCPSHKSSRASTGPRMGSMGRGQCACLHAGAPPPLCRAQLVLSTLPPSRCPQRVRGLPRLHDRVRAQRVHRVANRLHAPASREWAAPPSRHAAKPPRRRAARRCAALMCAARHETTQGEPRCDQSRAACAGPAHLPLPRPRSGRKSLASSAAPMPASSVGRRVTSPCLLCLPPAPHRTRASRPAAPTPVPRAAACLVSHGSWRSGVQLRPRRRLRVGLQPHVSSWSMNIERFSCWMALSASCWLAICTIA